MSLNFGMYIAYPKRLTSVLILPYWLTLGNYAHSLCKTCETKSSISTPTYYWHIGIIENISTLKHRFTCLKDFFIVLMLFFTFIKRGNFSKQCRTNDIVNSPWLREISEQNLECWRPFLNNVLKNHYWISEKSHGVFLHHLNWNEVCFEMSLQSIFCKLGFDKGLFLLFKDTK